MRNQGFTIIEILAITALMGLMAGATAWLLGGTLGSARLEDVVEQVAFVDSLSRRYARQSGQFIALKIDFEDQRIERFEGQGAQDVAAMAYALPKGFGIERLVLAEDSYERDQATIPYSADGRSPTYGLLISGPDKQSQWLIVAGLTGQVSVCEEQRIQEAMELLKAKNPPESLASGAKKAEQ